MMFLPDWGSTITSKGTTFRPQPCVASGNGLKRICRHEGPRASMTSDHGLVFDVDGVLVDSYDAHFESWQVVARETGFTFTEQRFIQTFGRTTREILFEMHGEKPLARQEITALDQRKEEVFRDILARGFPAMDGAVELIDELSAAGFRLAVGSSGPPANVDFVLRALHREACFGSVVTGEDVERGKPDPQVFRLAAARMGVEPVRCAVIEDAPAGVQAARAAGMTCIGLASKGRSFAQLQHADLVVPSLRALSSTRIKTLLDAR
jgi:beta-phosphoglucomutase